MVESIKNLLMTDFPVEKGLKAVTDSDGRFSLKLPSSGRYVLIAKASRRVFDKTENYSWLIWTNVKGEDDKSIMLSNQNLTSSNCADNVFKQPVTSTPVVY